MLGVDDFFVDGIFRPILVSYVIPWSYLLLVINLLLDRFFNLHIYAAIFGWLVLKLFSLSTARTSISFSSMNFKIGILDKIFLSCVSCRVSLSIFNSSTDEISSLISTSVLLKFPYFLSNFNWISASDPTSYSSRKKCCSVPSQSKRQLKCQI